MSFFAELKRRNVIRMAGLYLVGAWVIVQVAETVLPTFDVPNWVLRAIMIVIALGFLPTLIFAWVFELTPEGLKRDADVDRSRSIAPDTGRRMNVALAVLLSLVLVYLALDKFVLAPTRDALQVASSFQSKKLEGKIADDRSIAVLPFVNMSSDPEQEYFSDGLSEELLNQLAQIPQLRVIARTSSFSFKGKDVDVATIAEALHVDNVLEGSVRKSGNTLRITAQLIRTSDSSHLWSKTYDRQMADVFKVQDEIAGEVVNALKVTLLPEQKPSTSTRTSNVEAYNHYLRGRQLAALGSLEGNRQAIVEYEAAIAQDPVYVQAWLGLAVAQTFTADQTADPLLQTKASESVAKALELAPENPEAHAVRGWLRTIFQWDWQGAEADFKLALAAEPNNPETLQRHAWLLAALGRLSEAIASVRRANELDPVANEFSVYFAMYLTASGDYAQAREVLNRRLASSGKDDLANMLLGETLVLDGHPDKALEAVAAAPEGSRLVVAALAEHALGHASESARALDNLIKGYATGYAYQIAEAHAWRGDRDQAFAWLDRAYSQRDGGIAMIKFDPFLKSLHDDPRYLTLVRKLGLPE